MTISKNAITHLKTCLDRSLLFLIIISISACAGGNFNAATDLSQQISRPPIGFSEINQYAQRSSAAYLTPELIKAKFRKTIRVSTPKGTKTQYFLERDATQRIQFISVRGTANWTDIMFDAEVKVDENTSLGIPLHNGFKEIADAIYIDVKPHLKKGFKIRATGHSLGAAVVTIVALYLKQDGYEVDKVINFGQPKFTTVSGAKEHKSLPLHRVVDKNDVVPMLPPSGLLSNLRNSYAHIGGEVILLDGSDFIYIPSHDSGRLSVGEFWRSRSFASLEDHHVANYIKGIHTKLVQAKQVKYSQWVRK